MIRRPHRSTLHDTLFPDTTLFRTPPAGQDPFCVAFKYPILSSSAFICASSAAIRDSNILLPAYPPVAMVPRAGSWNNLGTTVPGVGNQLATTLDIPTKS